MKNVLTPVAKSVLMPLDLTAAASDTNLIIHMEMFEASVTALIISNEEMNGIIKLVKSLEESGLLIKGISKIAIKTKLNLMMFMLEIIYLK